VRKVAAGFENPYLFPDLAEDPWNIAQTRETASRLKGLTALEVCSGGGGQALGFEQAGIEHTALVEIDRHACATLRLNRPAWNVIEQDLNLFRGDRFKGVDIVSGGLPCPPFSIAGKQLGEADERNLFPAMIRLVDEIRPRAVMVENVRGILDPLFRSYREFIRLELKKLGYESGWRLMQAADFGVPQLRPRVAFVALRKEFAPHFAWPRPLACETPKVGDVLYDLMAAKGWKYADVWRRGAQQIAPTIVGGSHKHGGPDLGPTRARRAWAELGVDGLGIADEPPAEDFEGTPKLTVRMVARLQGFPDDWEFAGGKTAAYRQVGNAFPPPFARAIATRIGIALTAGRLARVAG
jgi:DNA (cytosine-5)-methyltransferase 1